MEAIELRLHSVLGLPTAGTCVVAEVRRRNAPLSRRDAAAKPSAGKLLRRSQQACCPRGDAHNPDACRHGRGRRPGCRSRVAACLPPPACCRPLQTCLTCPTAAAQIHLGDGHGTKWATAPAASHGSVAFLGAWVAVQPHGNELQLKASRGLTVCRCTRAALLPLRPARSAASRQGVCACGGACTVAAQPHIPLDCRLSPSCAVRLPHTGARPRRQGHAAVLQRGHRQRVGHAAPDGRRRGGSGRRRGRRGRRSGGRLAARHS